MVIGGLCGPAGFAVRCDCSADADCTVDADCTMCCCGRVLSCHWVGVVLWVEAGHWSVTDDVADIAGENLMCCEYGSSALYSDVYYVVSARGEESDSDLGWYGYGVDSVGDWTEVTG